MRIIANFVGFYADIITRNITTTMRKHPLFFLLVLVLTACQHSKPEPLPGPDPDPKPPGTFYTMQCRILRESLSSYETPMSEDLTRVSTDDLYGVQVWEEVAGGLTPYAYGLFDDISKMNLTLNSSSRYRFEATLFPGGKNHIAPNMSGTYRAPFTTSNGTAVVLDNTFVLTADRTMNGLSSGTTNLASVLPAGNYARPSISRLHGVLEHVTPAGDGTLEIMTKWVIFGLTINPIGFTEGKLTIEMEGAPTFELRPGDPPVDKRHYTFKRPNPATDDWLSDTYSEAIPIQITWTKADGTNVVILGRDNPDPLVFQRRINRTIDIDFTTESIPMDNGVSVGREIDPIIGSETTELQVPAS